MRVAIYSPYFDTLGGGELYMATIAQQLSKDNKVTIFWDEAKIKDQLQERFDLNLAAVEIAPDIFRRSIFKKWMILKDFDLGIYLSDGSIPFGLARRNVLHFQVPFHFRGQTLWNKLKLKRFQKIICNSFFTKRYIDQSFAVNSTVVYPPCNGGPFTPALKRNLILSVGRFDSLMQNKKQDFLIDAFVKNKSRFFSWELVLAGGCRDEGRIKTLRQKARRLPIRILPNLPRDRLVSLYRKAMVFWHAAGWGEKEPERMEHFGIAVVEAMAHGAVPVVFKGGGLLEIVDEGRNGFFFQNQKELIDRTLGAIQDEVWWRKLAQAARQKSRQFSQEKFAERIKGLVEKLE